MYIKPVLFGLALLCLSGTECYSQSVDSIADKAVSLPSRLLGKLQARTARLDQQLTQQTLSYLQKMQRREEKLRRKLSTVDSNAARQLFADSKQQYTALAQQISTDSGSRNTPLKGPYMPYVDSLRGALWFFDKYGGGVTGVPGASGVTGEFQTLQARMTDADQVKSFIQQRKQAIGQYIGQHSNLQGLLGPSYTGMNKDVYYYSQQLRQYKEMWNNPDQAEQQLLTLLNKLPAFQTFMKENSQLAGLFSVPGNYGAGVLSGQQTTDQVARQIQSQVDAGGPSGAATLQSNLQSAESQLDAYKNKLSQLGSGNGDMDLPDFKPNDQRTKTLWKRLEYGANFQTTRNNYNFPTVTDLGLSLGYKLGHSNVVGVGASYKIGWGNGIQHIALSSEGVGLRSFLELKIKGSFSATGGFEENYTTPFTSYQQLKQSQYWTRSGLIGLTKTVSMSNRTFKKTSLSLLWDFLSYQQVPRTQPILFRIGYTLN